MLISVKEIITQSLEIYKKNYRQLFAYMLMIFLPSATLSFVGAGSIYLYFYEPSSNLFSNLVILAVTAAGIIFSLWVTIALIRATKTLIEKKPLPAWKKMLGSTSHLIWPLIIVSILTLLIVLGGALLFIIPGIIFAIWYAFATYEVAVEEKKGLEALRESKKLVVGRWWGVLWRLIVPALLFGIAAAIASSIIEKILFQIFEESLPYLFLSSLFASAIEAIITPLSVLAMTILYLNLKNIKTETPKAEK